MSQLGLVRSQPCTIPAMCELLPRGREGVLLHVREGAQQGMAPEKECFFASVKLQHSFVDMKEYSFTSAKEYS